MRMPWPAALAALLGGALAAGAVDWTVKVRRAEVKRLPDAFEAPVLELPLGEEIEGTLEGDWVRVTDRKAQGLIHRSVLASEGELLKDPHMSFRIVGTFYPEDIQALDGPVNAWVRNPVVQTTPPAPRGWELLEFRRSGGLLPEGR